MGRDEEWKNQTIANTSEAQFEQEYGNSFLGTGNIWSTVIPYSVLKHWRLTGLRMKLESMRDPKKVREYICTVDVSKGRGLDYSTFSIFDVTESPFRQVCTYRDNSVSPMLYPDLLNKYCRPYNDALIIIENNAEGGMVATQLHYDIEYPNVFVQGMTKADDIGVTMSRRIKRIGCSTMKELLEENRLIVVDRHTITELMTFVNKGSSFEADKGYHDDMVMNLVLFSWFITTDYFTSLTDKQVKDLLYSEQQKLIEDDILPVGVFNHDHKEETFVDKEGDRWYIDNS